MNQEQISMLDLDMLCDEDPLYLPALNISAGELVLHTNPSNRAAERQECHRWTGHPQDRMCQDDQGLPSTEIARMAFQQD